MSGNSESSGRTVSYSVNSDGKILCRILPSTGRRVVPVFFLRILRGRAHATRPRLSGDRSQNKREPLLCSPHGKHCFAPPAELAGSGRAEAEPTRSFTFTYKQLPIAVFRFRCCQTAYNDLLTTPSCPCSQEIIHIFDREFHNFNHRKNRCFGSSHISARKALESAP